MPIPLWSPKSPVHTPDVTSQILHVPSMEPLTTLVKLLLRRFSWVIPAKCPLMIMQEKFSTYSTSPRSQYLMVRSAPALKTLVSSQTMTYVTQLM